MPQDLATQFLALSEDRRRRMSAGDIPEEFRKTQAHILEILHSIHVTDAGTATFFINDTQVGSAMANAVTTSTLLTPVVAGFSRTNAYKAAYVKYIDAEVRR